MELKTETLFVFDKSVGNLIMNMLKIKSEIYEGDERTYIDKGGDKVVSSYSILFLPHNSCRFSSCVVLNSLAKELKDLKKKDCQRIDIIIIPLRC